MSRSTGISIVNLSKRYGTSETYALQDVTLQVALGEVYGFLGPNGAGKSTTIRILMNFLQPTNGTATILGKDVVKDSIEIRRTVGYLAGDFAVYPKLTGNQYLRYLDELQGGGNLASAKRLATLFNADLGKRLGDLSRGNRQKIGLIQAFMHKPEVLILDEPTSGLDPLMQEVFYQLINEAKLRGATVFISSHILSEVQKTCDRVGIIRQGKLVTERVISDLVQEAAQTFDISFAAPAPVDALKKVQGLKLMHHSGADVTLSMQGSLRGLFEVLALHEVIKMDAHNLDLEEMFMHFYEDGSKQS